MRDTETKFNRVLGIVGAGLLLAVLIIPRLRSDGDASTRSKPSETGRQPLWKYKSESGGIISVALGPDGTVYAGTNNVVHALSPDGNVKWKASVPGMQHLSIGSDGTIYATSSHGLIYGLGSDGKIVWDPRVGLIGFDAPAAVGAGGLMLYANTVSDLYAFNPQRSTTAVWSQSTFREGAVSENVSLPGRARVGQMPSKNSPVIWRDETILLARQHWLHYFDPYGTPGWFDELTPGTLGQAALDDDGVAYVPDDLHTIYAVTHQGNLKWKYAADGGVLGSPVVGVDGTIYIATSGTIHAISPDGSAKWKVKMGQSCMTSPVLAADGTMYIGGDIGLFALNSDGSEKWYMRTGTVSQSPTISPDGSIYFPCGYMWVCAAKDAGSPLAKSPWPKIYHDAANTSRILTPF